MKSLLPYFFLSLILLAPGVLTADDKRAGFYLPDSLRETSMTYHSQEDLVILSVTVNKTLHLNLVMDTGCRNVLLFGRRFRSMFTLDKTHKIKFSGLGEGRSLEGDLSLGNTIALGSITGENMPVVIVPSNELFSSVENVDGIIGYDLFLRFEIELEPSKTRITFRSATTTCVPEGYRQIPVRIEDSRMLLNSSISLNNVIQNCDLMIDTGSSLGLLLKTTDLSKLNITGKNTTLGRGLNGVIEGYETHIDKLTVEGFQFDDLPCSVTKSPWHNYASIGMNVLKNYNVVINYFKGYICLKPVAV